MPIDDTRNFIALNIALLTVSDTRTLANDKSGDLLYNRITKSGHSVINRSTSHDDITEISDFISKYIANNMCHIIITTGGTGITARDVTPEAVQPFFDKEIIGFGELFRMLSYKKIGTSTLQSRACAGIANRTLIFSLPGSPSACKDAWDDILYYQLDNRHRPCNFVELLDRL